MSNIFQGHTKVTVNALSISSLVTKKRANLLTICTKFEIHGSITAPTHTGILQLADGSGLIQSLPILGQEILEVNFTTPDRQSYSRLMWVYGKPAQEFDPNGTHIHYIIKFVSIDQNQALLLNVDQGYNEQISVMANNILNNKLKTKRTISIEDTKGIENIVIPHWTCWKAMEFLRQRAVSQNYNSPYLFFEDQNSYHFKSYEQLIKERTANTSNIITFTNEPYLPAAGSVSNKSTVLEKQKRNIDMLKIDSKTDTIDLLHNGGLSTRTVLFDIINKSTSNTDINYNDATTLIKQPFGDQFYPTQNITFDNNIPPPTQYFIPFDSSNPAAVTKQYGARKLYTSLLQNQQLNFTAAGDTQIQPGDIINMIMPGRSNNPTNDTQISGQYLIIEFKHSVSVPESQMYTTIVCNRMGYQQKVL